MADVRRIYETSAVKKIENTLVEVIINSYQFTNFIGL